jgi:dienelactone hydrolase
VARGFESKDVEQQQQEAAERRAQAGRVVPTAEEIARATRRSGLQLQRTRVLREIEASTTERHRQTLRKGLEFLEQQLAELGSNE